MVEYPKINTLYKRDFGNKGVIIPDQVTNEAFLNIKRWHAFEKIDGTNIRIEYLPNTCEVRYRGRTDGAQLYGPLVEYLQKTFTVKLLQDKFPPDDELGADFEVTIYGEGIGPKIQKGCTDYSKESSLIIFDVKVDKWWLEYKNVQDIANYFGVRYVPDLGYMTLDKAIEFVKESPKSIAAIHNLDRVMEGVVVRPEPLLLLRDGTPLFVKIKVEDFQKYERMKKEGLI